MASEKSKHVCLEGQTYAECELEILQDAINFAENRQKKEVAESVEVQQIIEIAKKFMRKHKLLNYGGTAINESLPAEDRIYSNLDFTDIDVYSPNALQSAKDLCDEYFALGFREVEGKSAVHHGTYKVFVNFMPVADISQMPVALFRSLSEQAIERDGMLYCPPNFLRMAMYLELSRPNGVLERWQKVFKRLSKLNKHYPLSIHKCKSDDFQRESIVSTSIRHTARTKPLENSHELSDLLKTVFIENGAVFFGAFAMSLYSQYMPIEHRQRIKHVADFDVLAEDAEALARTCRRKLREVAENVSVVRHAGIAEVIPIHYEICVGVHTVAFVYETIACHAYNLAGNGIKVASIDTILSFYLAFIYADRPYYNKTRLLCMSDYLFKVQQYNRLEQTGLLQRFSTNCIGHQENLIDMRMAKMKMYEKLKNHKGTTLYDEWFLRYRPSETRRKRRKRQKTRKRARTRK